MKKVLFVLFEDFGKILDGGDQCNKRNLNVLQSLCGENNVDIIICDWLSVTDNSKFETPAIEWVFNDINKYEGLLYTTIMPSTCNKIIKKSLYDNMSAIFDSEITSKGNSE